MIEKTYPIALKLLENGLALSMELQELLVKEENELKQNTDSERLSTIIVNKKEKVSQLEQFSKQFSQVLTTEKLPMTASGIADYFALAKKTNINASKLTTLWKKIVASSKKSQLLNQKNGASINILAQYTPSLLAHPKRKVTASPQPMVQMALPTMNKAPPLH